MKFVTLYDSKAFIPEEKGRPLALTSWLKATLLLCCEKTKSPIVKEVSRSSTAAGKSLWRPPFTSTVVPTFPPVVAAFYENSSSPTTVYYLRFSCGVSRALFASLLVLFFAEDLLRRRVCRKKGRRRMLYGQMAPDTHFSWSHHEGKNGCWKYTTSSFQTPWMLKAIPHVLPNRHDPQLFS